MNIRGPYSAKTGESFGLSFHKPSRTKQSFAEEADINTLVRRFNITGQIPQNVRPPLLEDFTDVFDFHSAQNALVEANRSFMRMPSSVRNRFQNDPAQFVEFCSNPENLEEMRKMGLADPVKTVVESVQKVEIVNPAPPVAPPK